MPSFNVPEYSMKEEYDQHHIGNQFKDVDGQADDRVSSLPQDIRNIELISDKW